MFVESKQYFFFNGRRSEEATLTFFFVADFFCFFFLVALMRCNEKEKKKVKDIEREMHGGHDHRFVKVHLIKNRGIERLKTSSLLCNYKQLKFFFF